jgi:hypothetical protein
VFHAMKCRSIHKYLLEKEQEEVRKCPI